MSFLDDLFEDPAMMALLGGAAIAATGGAAAPAVLAAEGGAAAAGGLLGQGAFLGEGIASGIPAWGLAAGSGVDAMGKLKAAGSMASEYAKPAMQGMQAAKTAQGLLSGPQAQPAPAQQRGAPLDLSSIFQANQQSQQFDAEESQRRQKELEQYARNMMGGR